MIPPELQTFFDWQFEQTETTVTVSMNHSATFNTDLIEVKLWQNGDHSYLNVSLPSLELTAPVVGGELFDVVHEERHFDEDNIFKVVLTKIEQTEWPLVIQNSDPQTKKVDPKTAYLIYIIYTDNNTDINQLEMGLNYLAYSADAGYVPSIRALADHYLDMQEQRRNGFDLLRIAANYYHDPLSQFKLGILLCYSDDLKENGIQLLKDSASRGYNEAYLVLGRMYSPLCDTPYEKKDPAQAFKYFEQRNNIKPDSRVLHEMAKLYLTGLGVEKDEQKANELQTQAEALDSDVEKLDAKAINTSTEHSSGQAIVIGLLTGVTALLAGLTLFQIINRRK